MISDAERAVYESFKLPLVLCSPKGGLVHLELVSDGMCETFHLPRDKMDVAIRGGMEQYTHPDDVEFLAIARGDLLTRRKELVDLVFRNRPTADSDYVFIHVIGRWQTMADGSEYAMFVYFDMGKTESGIGRIFRSAAGENSDIIYRDPISTLPNLNYFRQFADQHITAMRALNKGSVFLYYDVKDMKGYNAQYGYVSGDKLLRAIGRALTETYPGALLARGADDSFFVLTTCNSKEETAESVERVNAAVRSEAFGAPVVRAGIYRIGPGARAVNAIDGARQAVAELGDNLNVMYRFYTAQSEQRRQAERYLLDSFEAALAQRHIRVYYQPIVRTKTGKMTALEALARWIDPQRGVIPPDDFVPLLSRYHLTHRLDLYMVEQVCTEFAARAEAQLPLLPVSINFNAKDFDHMDIPAELERILGRHGLGHDNLIIELTERDIATGTEFFRTQLRRLREMGFRLWIDDFGSAYSSLNVFSRYDIDRVKFDMDLLRHLDDNGGVNRHILRAMTTLCREIGVHTLCEGVETAEQRAFLEEIDCEMSQGYLFFRPQPLEDAVDRILTAGPTMNFESREEEERHARAWIDRLVDPDAAAGK